MALYGVGLEVEMKRLLLDFRMKLAQKGFSRGLKQLRFAFRKADLNGNRKLDPTEFRLCLNQVGLIPSTQNFNALMKYLDLNRDGCIDFEEFLKAVRGEMNERRKILVQSVFAKLDRDNKGVVDMQEVAKTYNCSRHPEVKSGRKTEEEVFTEFMQGLEGCKNIQDGMLTLQEFYDYYTDISVSISNDIYFVEMIENVWNTSQEPEIDKAQIAKLLNLLREKLVVKTKGAQDEYLLRKLFKQFDVDNSGQLTINELNALCLSLEVPLERRLTQGLLKHIDKDNTGSISFEEFCEFVVNGTYTRLT